MKEKETLTQYLEETYGDTHNLFIYKSIYYDRAASEYVDLRGWDLPVLVCYVRDELILDIDFGVGLHDTTIYDTYRIDVGSLGNTRSRIDSELSTYIKDTVFRSHQTNATSFGGYYIYDFDTIHDYMYLDMPFDAKLPYKVEIFIYTPYESYGNDLSAFAADIEQWHRMALAADMDIENYRIVDDATNNWDAAYILTPYEIENEDIVKLLADKSKDNS